MDYFRDAFHLVYLFRLLLDIKRNDLVEQFLDYPLSDGECVDYDTVYEAAGCVTGGIFETTADYYNEDKEVNTYVMADKVMNDFYSLADEYGELNCLGEEDNPYFKKADKEAHDCFGFSYNISWLISHDRESKSRFKNKLVILTYEYEEYSFVGLAIGVARMYEFFSTSCAELSKLLFEETEAEAA